MIIYNSIQFIFWFAFITRSPFFTSQTLNYMNFYFLSKKYINYPKIVYPTIQKMIITNSILGAIIANSYIRKKLGLKELSPPNRPSSTNSPVKRRMRVWHGIGSISKLHSELLLQSSANSDDTLNAFAMVGDIITHWIPFILIYFNYDNYTHNTKGAEIEGFLLNISLSLFYFIVLFLQLKVNNLNTNIFNDIKNTYTLRTNEFLVLLLSKLIIDLLLHFNTPNIKNKLKIKIKLVKNQFYSLKNLLIKKI